MLIMGLRNAAGADSVTECPGDFVAASCLRACHGGLEGLQDRFGGMGAFEDRAHALGLVAVAFEVAVLKHDSCPAAALSEETDFDLGDARRIGLVVPVGTDVPAQEDAVRRVERED